MQFKAKLIVFKPLELQKAAVSMHYICNGLFQKLLQVTIKNYLDGASIVLTKQHYQLLLESLIQIELHEISSVYLHKPEIGPIGQCLQVCCISHNLR